MNPSQGDSVRPALAIDLGGTQLRAALVSPDGRLSNRVAVATDVAGGPRAVVRQMQSLVRQVTQPLREADGGDDVSRLVAGVGVCSPGPLDPEAGVVLSISTLPGWMDVPLVAWLSEAIELPVHLDNDAVSALLGEWRFGAGRGLTDLVYVTVSTGIGGGVLADGRVLRGRRQMAAHVGHMTTAPQGEVCTCGNRGCWEAQACGPALAEKARRAVASASASSPSLLSTCGPQLSAAQVFQAAEQGDALAQSLVEVEAFELGVGIVNLLHLFSPQRVILGGGVSTNFERLRPGITAQIQRRALPPFKDVPVVQAALGGDAGLVGAASLVWAGPG